MTGFAGAVDVRDLRAFQRDLKRLNADAAKTLREGLKEAGEPVRADAEQKAVAGIRNIGSRWSRMKLGITTKEVYIAEAQRGPRAGSQKSRPNLAIELMEQALGPALDAHIEEIPDRVRDAIDKTAREHNL